MTVKTILLLEDDKSIALVLTAALEEAGFEIEQATSLAERAALLDRGQYAALLTDVMLPDGDGIASLAAVRARAPDLPVIVISAQNTLDTAIRASEAGAFEYFPKPFDLAELVRVVEQAVRPGVTPPDDDPAEDESLPLVGRSAAMQALYRMMTRVLRNDLTVLLLGESGTGKDLVAEAIHELGQRRTGPFVAVNCAAIPHDLIESELFGHERGAFTGATTQSIGKFEQANGGTLFLDEIGDMPATAQTRLLRTLQSGRISRVGGKADIAVDVRIIAATNRDLSAAVTLGDFREDLFYRLNVVPVRLPPLRERRDDIAPLARHFLREATREGLPQRSLADDAVALLETHDWPGNVRELRNLVFRAALVAREERIDAALLAPMLAQSGPGSPAAGSGKGEAGFASVIEAWIQGEQPESGTVYHAAQAALERPLFELALARSSGNQLQAARWLGINRNTLRKRLTDLDIDTGRFSPRF